jgi:hypothetical protein
MVVMTMTMVRLRKCRSRNHQDHGEKQSLFHVHHHNNKVTARYAVSRNFWVTHLSPMMLGQGQEKSLSAVTTGLRLCRVRKKKTRATSK